VFVANDCVRFQDTIMSQKGMHFMGKSLIVGATDFIFGQYGILWVEECDIKVVNALLGYVTGMFHPPFLFLPLGKADEDNSKWKRKSR
jgi:hypothetical protein